MLFLKFILAFCSLSYELILAQGLAAFLDNTVLRYSTTIGLYMFMMGLGSLASVKTDIRRPAISLWQTEILLTLTGAAGVASFFIFSGWEADIWLMMTWSYFLVALIGFLTGLELPLMLMMATGDERGHQRVISRESLIAVDYIGSFAAALVFVICFYPWAGLIRSVMAVAFLNALAAVFISSRWREDFGEEKHMVCLASLVLSGGAFALLLLSGSLETLLLMVYAG